MFDINKHKFLLVQILKDIYSDTELATSLAFKGGTAAMLFYDLPRFSVDLDFNLINIKNLNKVYKKINDILSNYGSIKDKAIKYYGAILVLDYGTEERNLKVEISTRKFPDSYITKNYLGIYMKILSEEDMFSHKLCALTDRSVIANRDIFDCRFFMQKRTAINQDIIESRMAMSYKEYLNYCINKLSKKTNKKILDGLGELLDKKQKKIVKNQLLDDTIKLFKLYREFPIIKK